MSDHEVIILCNKNDRRAQQILFNSYKRKVMGICLRYASSPEADDIMQESFIKIFNSLRREKALKIRSLGAWITRITVNTAINNYNRVKEPERLEDIGNHHYGSPIESGLENLQTEDLIALIQSMPNGYRMVFNLSLVEGFDHSEIAAMLGISESSSRSQLTRAREWLKQKLNSQDAYHERLIR
jgi:RNA polymerase sigma factor (sigma-70 family)